MPLEKVSKFFAKVLIFFNKRASYTKNKISNWAIMILRNMTNG